jgi:3-hydroxybutyryl-CoA dehydrogenase
VSPRGPRVVHTIGVVGAGTMGAGIAQSAAQAGFRDRVYDVEDRFLERGRDAIDSSLARLVERGRISDADRHAARARLSYSTDRAPATSGDDAASRARPG